MVLSAGGKCGRLFRGQLADKMVPLRARYFVILLHTDPLFLERKVLVALAVKRETMGH